MVLYWDHMVALARAVRDAGLYLERNAQRRDPRLVREVNVHVLADILLLVDLLKPASMVLEKQPRSVHAIPARNAAGTMLHHPIFACKPSFGENKVRAGRPPTIRTAKSASVLPFLSHREAK
jgi:hypothetical protein